MENSVCVWITSISKRLIRWAIFCVPAIAIRRSGKNTNGKLEKRNTLPCSASKSACGSEVVNIYTLCPRLVNSFSIVLIDVATPLICGKKVSVKMPMFTVFAFPPHHDSRSSCLYQSFLFQALIIHPYIITKITPKNHFIFQRFRHKELI